MLTDKMIGTLEDFSFYEGTEYGEFIGSLLDMNRNKQFQSYEFGDMLNTELENNYNIIISDYERVEEEETRVTKVISWEPKE